MKKIVWVALLGLSLLSFNVSENDTSRYDFLPQNSQIEIDLGLAKKIEAAIIEADANLFMDGRNISEAEKPDMVVQTIKDAMNYGGTSAANTYFRDSFGDDMVSINLNTQYEKGSLKMIKQFARQSTYTSRSLKPKINVRNEIVWLYEVKIKVNYRVTVDGEDVKGTHYQSSEIISPLRLK
jgi:hypothetical protein